MVKKRQVQLPVKIFKSQKDKILTINRKLVKKLKESGILTKLNQSSQETPEWSRNEQMVKKSSKQQNKSET